MEIKDPGRSFTWSNNQDTPVLAVLDRVLANVEWESKYPLVNLKILPKGCSDHNPLRVNFGQNNPRQEHRFWFEKWWFETKGFEEVVMKAWDIRCPSPEPLDIWQFKIRNLRKKIERVE
jgi:hypothetical protein